MKYTRKKPLRIGTDCSGIEAPIQALEQLQIPHVHVWSSEINKHCITSIKANYKPEIIYGDSTGPFPDGDITKRDNSKLPDIDLYVCGFPCQPFSNVGLKKGLDDTRGTVFFSCIDVITKKQPRYFILENVRGILTNNKKDKKDKYGETWKVILEKLKKLKGYKVDWKVMNTKDYGIPQSRPRVYIVGTKDNFEWPEKKPMERLENYIDHSNNKKEEKLPDRGIKMINNKEHKNSIFLDMQFENMNFKYSNLYCSCIIRSSTIINIKYKRRATNKELLMLQGFNTDFDVLVSQTQFRYQIGNSMSVNVLKCIIINLV